MAKRRTIPFIITLLGLTLLITVHELGHFVMCKLFNIRTPVFSIGFGPRLFGIEIGQTLFQIAALPLGGYVSINEHDLGLAPYYQKAIIITAGVLFNLIFAALLLFWFFYTRKGQPVTTIASILPGSPAAQAGIMEDDIVIMVDNKKVDDDVGLFLKEINEHPDQTRNFRVIRNGSELDIPVNLGSRLGGQVGALGVTLQVDSTKKLSMMSALTQAVKNTYAMLSQTVQIFFNTFTKKEDRKKIGGPIGLIATTTESYELGPQMYLVLLSSISTQLAFFNILPIPLLDGGKLLIYTIEFFYGKPLTPKLIGIINLITLVVILILLMYLSLRDIRRLRRQKK